MNILDRVVCLVGPSGVGKTSYAKRLVKKHRFVLSSVITTRQHRSDDDERYQYVTDSVFIEMVNSGFFLEWDKYSDYHYGTPIRGVEEIANSECHTGVILDLTPNGCKKVLEVIPTATIIALLPDNPTWLFERLISRNSQPLDEIQARTKLLKSYLDEMKLLVCRKVYASFSPDSWDKTFGEIESIIFSG